MNAYTYDDTVLIIFCNNCDSIFVDSTLSLFGYINNKLLIVKKSHVFPNNFDTVNIKIYYYDDVFDFNTLQSELPKYKYCVYLTDKYVYTGVNHTLVTKYITNMIAHNIDQIRFGITNTINTYVTSTCDGMDIVIPSNKHNDFDSIHNVERYCDDIVMKDSSRKNKFSIDKQYDIDVNFNNYMSGKYNYGKFVLEPSIISLISVNYLKDFKSVRYNIYEQSLKFNDLNVICINNTLNEVISPAVNIPISNDTTLVTAFINIGPRDAKRSTQKYDYMAESMKTLLLDVNMHIFVSEEIAQHVKDTRKDKLDKTHITIVSCNDLYMIDRLDEITDITKDNHPPYNKPTYIMAVNTRYNLIKKSIEQNIFNSKYYGWLDFSAGHIVTIPPKYSFYKNINNDDKIRVSWICRYVTKSKTIVYNHNCLGGGLFCGRKDVMLKLIDEHDKQFRLQMEAGYCKNDDSTLFYIFMKNPELFDCYPSSYNNILVKL